MTEVEGGPYRGGGVPSAPIRRQLPLALRARLVLGNHLAASAFALALLGSAMGWSAAADSPLLVPTISGPTARAQATIVGIRIHKRKGRESDREARYVFTVDGRDYRGVSWDSHERAARGGHQVVYQVSNPNRSVLLGMRQTKFEPWAVLLFGGLGMGGALVFLIIAWFRARRAMVLLAKGRLAERAVVVGSAAIPKSSDRTLTYQYWVDAGDPQVCQMRVNKRYPFVDGASAQALYHPTDPSKAVVLDALPGAPRMIDDHLEPGRWPRRIPIALATLVAVNLVLAAIGGFRFLAYIS